MPTRIIWLTFIASMDQDGFAQYASAANLAHRARVSLEEAEAAVAILEAPDKNSSDEENEGRRVERVPGGWMILNSEKYKDIVTASFARESVRVRVKRHRAKKANVTQCNVTSVTCNASETETHTDTEDIYGSCNGKNVTKEEEEVLTYLNQKAGTSYRPAQGSLKHISARLKEGATVEECCKVIDIKVQEWKNDPKMSKYLRPQTLFNSEKFHSYNGQTHIIKKPSQSWDSSEPFVASNI